MTGCSADYCTNSSNKGFKMVNFPKNEQRRKVWIACVNRKNWIPSRGAALCEVHFAEDMWEVSQGKKCLKRTAVPTIFDQHSVKLVPSHDNSTSVVIDDNNADVIVDSSKMSPEKCCNDEVNVDSMSTTSAVVPDNVSHIQKESLSSNLSQDNCGQSPCQPSVSGLMNLDHNSINSDDFSLRNECANEECSKEKKKLLERLHTLEKLYDKCEKSRIRMRKDLKAARERIRYLNKQNTL